jgi:uncharacterized protein YuzE
LALWAVHHAEDHGQVIINYDDENRVVEIEILDASKVFGSILAEAIKSPEKKVIGIV